MIQRRIVLSITLAVVYGSLLILIGYYLYRDLLLDISVTISLVGLFLILGILFNSWLILRLMHQLMRAIKQIENFLVEKAEYGRFKSEQNLSIINLDSTPSLQLFYSLLNHVNAIETRYLEFLAKFAHEIRSPLTSILGYSEMLTDPELRHNEQFIDRCYEVIHKQGNQMSRLIEDAVMTIEIDSGQYQFRFSKLDLVQFLEILVREARDKSCRQINFQNLAGEVCLSGDLISLREAFHKLIDNGVKFSKPDTPISIVLRRSERPGWVEISVKDSGIGMDEKDKPTLFRRFSMIRNDLTRDNPGYGLGLYIAEQIVRYHHGKITVDSMRDEGSTFTIHLPQE